MSPHRRRRWWSGVFGAYRHPDLFRTAVAVAIAAAQEVGGTEDGTGVLGINDLVEYRVGEGFGGCVFGWGEGGEGFEIEFAAA